MWVWRGLKENKDKSHETNTVAPVSNVYLVSEDEKADEANEL